MDSTNPVFIKTFILNYCFQDENTEQNFLIQAYYIKSLISADDLSQQIFIGEELLNLRDLINSPNQEKDLKIKNQKLDKVENLGIIKIRAVEREENYEFLSIKFGIRELISKNPICLKIHIKKHLSEWWPILITKQISHKTKISFWELSEIPLNSLNGGVLGEVKIKFEIIEYLKNERIKSLGNLTMNVKDFLKAPAETEISLSRRFKNYLLIQDYNKFKRFKFFDYLISDLNIKLFLFTDCTSSAFNKENFEFLTDKNPNILNNKITILNMTDKKDLSNSNIIKDDFENNKDLNNTNILINNNTNVNYNKNITNINLKNNTIKNLKNNNSNINYLMSKKTNVVKSNIIKLKTKKSELQSLMEYSMYENKPVYSESMKDMILLNKSIIKFFVNFDSDGKFPMYCYGAKLPELKNNLNNCFSANMDMMKPEVNNFLESIQILLFLSLYKNNSKSKTRWSCNII